MPLDDATKQKADQLAHKFFTKFTILVGDARSYAQAAGAEAGKTDKWFNLETADSDTFKDHLKIYRSVSSLSANVLLPMELQVLLTVPELSPTQVLTYRLPGKSRQCVEPPGGPGQLRNILLERWSCKFLPPPPSSSTSSVSEASSTSTASSDDSLSVPLATVYKHALSTFRSLYSLLHILPSARVCRRVRRAGGSGLGVSVRVLGEVEGRVLGFGEPIAQNGIILPTKSFNFDPVPHPMGMLSLSVTYLSAPQFFELDSREALLSSEFLSAADKANTGQGKAELDVPFTPTLARNREAQSQTQSANLRALGAARSPPRNVPAGNGNNVRRGGYGGFFENAQASASSSASGGPPGIPGGNSGTSLTGIVDRFAPSSPRSGMGLRTGAVSATGAVQRSQSAGVSSTEVSFAVVGPGESSIGAGSTGSLSSREEMGAGLARHRRQSSAGTGRDLPSSPSPSSLPARRPSMNVINPFKSSTLIHSGSPRQTGSPLAGPSLPSARGLTFPTMGSPAQSSVSGIAAFRTPSSPGFKSPLAIATPSSLRNSPPVTGSGLAQADRRMPLSSSPGSASASSVSGSSHVAAGVPVRRRYSSQLSHRYDREKTGGGSEGASSGGSAGAAVDKIKALRERKNSSRDNTTMASYVSNTNTDDDDLSSFVQEIDSRRPLAGGVALSDEGVTSALPPMSSSPTKGSRKGAFSSASTKNSEQSAHDTSDGTNRFPQSGLSTSPGRRGLHFERTLSEVAEREREPSSPAETSSMGNAIDERLRRMNEAFRASLTGLARRGSSSSSPSSAVGTPAHSSGEEQKSPSSAVEESPSTPLAPLARATPPEGRERTSALTRYMRMAASPPTTEQHSRFTNTPPSLVATQSEGGDGEAHRSHRSSSNTGMVSNSRRTRSDYDAPSTDSGSDPAPSSDRHRYTSTRVRVTNISRASGSGHHEGPLDEEDSRKSSAYRSRPGRDPTVG